MKHSWKITTILILVFFIAQVVGLNIVSQYVDIDSSSLTGETVLEEDMYFVEPPRVENESNSWIYLLTPILVGTGIFLLLIKFNLKKTWKAWFFLSILMALAIALYPYVLGLFNLLGLSYSLSATIFLALVLSYFKIFKKNLVVHNLTEIFVYGGIAALFVPIINITSGVIVLILIAIYDAYAVWKSRHMVKMAEFQSSSGLFAGLSIPYSLDKKNKSSKSIPKGAKTVKVEKKVQAAILGGGDIAFPMIFSGAVLKITGVYLNSYLVIIGATMALITLFVISKKGRFYPAMPFISSGCLVGYLISLLF